MKSSLVMIVSYISSVFALNCHKTITVKDQRDFDQIQGCQNLTGDIIIDSSASGSLEIRGPTNIFGIIRNQDCQQNDGEDCTKESALTQLSASSKLTRIVGLNIKGLSSLNKISLPSLTVLQSLQLHDMPQLTTFESGIGHLDRLTLANVPKLATFTHGKGHDDLGWLEPGKANSTSSLDNVGFKSLDFLSDLYLCSGGVSIRNAPHLDQFTFKGTSNEQYHGPIEIQGNGRLNIAFNRPIMQSGLYFTQPVTFSGISDLSLGKTPHSNNNNSFPSIHMEDLTIHDTSIEMLKLPFHTMNNVTVRDNPQLTAIHSGAFQVYNVSIIDNPSLKLDKSVGEANSSQWMWRYSLEMAIKGPVTTDFFTPMYLRDKDEGHLTKLSVTSTLSEFDCKPLKKALSDTVFKHLVCQGKVTSLGAALYPSVGWALSSLALSVMWLSI